MTLARIRSQKWWLLGIAVIGISILLRFWRLDQPKGYYFDEVYHAVTAKLIGRNDPRAYEWWNPVPEPNTAVDWLHPPYAKLAQGFSMYLLGETEMAWRLSSAIVGTLSLWLLWNIAFHVTRNRSVALLATVLFALDGLALTMSRIAMNDMHVTAAILFSVWMYLRWKEQPNVVRALWVAVGTGIAVGTKWSGVFLVPLFFFDQTMSVLWALLHGKVVTWKPRAILALALAWLIPALYLLSYQQMFWQGKDWAHFRALHDQIWWYQTHLDATHPYQSTPVQWILNLRPVYAYTGSSGTMIKDIYLQGNPILFWVGIIAVFWLLCDLIFISWNYLRSAVAALHGRLSDPSQTQPMLQEIERSSTQWFLLAAYSVFWLPWIISPRIMFFYHYLPSVPFLALIMATQLQILSTWGTWGKRLAALLIFLTGVCFVLFLPHWMGWPVPAEPWQNLYFALESWR